MKVVVAVDSFKGSLTSLEAGEAVREGILAAKPQAEVLVRPLADGGEGTTELLIAGLGGIRRTLTVTGPLGKPVEASYGWLEESRTAVMEMVSAAGLVLVAEGERDPLRATSRGLGEMIADAVRRGAREFVIGIGGSATNDGGLGMLKALGYTFLDCDGADAGEGAQALERVAAIQKDQVLPGLDECRFLVACDVNNPLCGREGATFVYGPQKGVSEEMKPILDRAMRQYAVAVSRAMGNDYADEPGAGAAGGMGFAFLSCLNARLVSGTELILETLRLEEDIRDADVVVTGEGRLDRQTAMGKAPGGVARIAGKYGVRVIAFAGSIGEGASDCNEAGIHAYFPILRKITSLEEAMEPEYAKANLRACAEQVFRLLRLYSEEETP